MQKFLRQAAAAAALFGLIGSASADVITFDAADTTYLTLPPLILDGDFLTEGAYVYDVASQYGGFVGALINGADASTCSGVACPTNNTTTYLASLNDGVPRFARQDGRYFNVKQFDGAFIDNDGSAIPAVPLLLQVVGWLDSSFTSYITEVVPLTGVVNGTLNFSTISLTSSFASTAFVEVDFYGYSCDTAGNCARASNLAQFGLDNVVLTAPVPEPSTWALFGLGLAAVGFARRRASKTSA